MKLNDLNEIIGFVKESVQEELNQALDEVIDDLTNIRWGFQKAIESIGSYTAGGGLNVAEAEGRELFNKLLSRLHLQLLGKHTDLNAALIRCCHQV